MMSFDSIFSVFGNTEVICSRLIEEEKISELDEIVMMDCWRWRWRQPEDLLD